MDWRSSVAASRDVDLTPFIRHTGVDAGYGRWSREAERGGVAEDIRQVRGKWPLGTGVLPAGRHSAIDLHSVAAAREGRAHATADGPLSLSCLCRQRKAVRCSQLCLGESLAAKAETPVSIATVHSHVRR